jgi:GNAT superfamily N-acetyltransferase
MPDLLVKLYDLPTRLPVLERLAADGIEIRRALPAEKTLVSRWVTQQFTVTLSSECEIAFCREPVACVIALRGDELLGFCCHGVACPDFLGPLGVLPAWRKREIGKALLLTSLDALRSQGYAYAIIGWAGPTAFFERTVNATPIANSEPGIYRGILKAGNNLALGRAPDNEP